MASGACGSRRQAPAMLSQGVRMREDRWRVPAPAGPARVLHGGAAREPEGDAAGEQQRAALQREVLTICLAPWFRPIP